MTKECHEDQGQGRYVDGRVLLLERYGWSLLIAVFVSAILGCSSTKLTNSWTDKSFQSPGYHKVLVIAVTKSSTTRRSVEEEFASQLKARRNMEAMSSATLIPNDSDLERSQIVKASRENGFDAVMVIQLLGLDKTTRYVPGVMYVPTHSAYAGLPPTMHTPGHVVQHEIVRLETELYDVNSERLVWGGTTESFSPSSVSKLVDELAEVVLEGMDKDKVL